jgi:hypothetical protein
MQKKYVIGALTVIMVGFFVVNGIIIHKKTPESRKSVQITDYLPQKGFSEPSLLVSPDAPTYALVTIQGKEYAFVPMQPVPFDLYKAEVFITKNAFRLELIGKPIKIAHPRDIENAFKMSEEKARKEFGFMYKAKIRMLHEKHVEEEKLQI